MKIRLWLNLIIIPFLVSCANSSSPSLSSRQAIIAWARQIANIEKRLEYEVAQAKPLTDTITSRLPTQYELDLLVDYSNRVTALYNDMVNVEAPYEARSVHDKYVENYAKIADSVRYYVLAVKLNDLTYFDKSVTAAQEANRIGSEAYNDFEALLNYYSISCSEMDFCE